MTDQELITYLKEHIKQQRDRHRQTIEVLKINFNRTPQEEFVYNWANNLYAFCCQLLLKFPEKEHETENLVFATIDELNAFGISPLWLDPKVL